VAEVRWKANLKHLQVALERVIHNFAEHSGIGKKVAAAHVERIAKEIREREEKKR
jgi:hypothetical protein